MKKTRILFVLGLSAVFSSLAYAGDTEPAECDDAVKPPYTVKITVDASDHSKPPVVEPDTVCAGFHDDITFTANVDRFFVTFNRYSPFMANMNGAKGKAVGKVNVKFNEHNEGQNSYQYTVHVPGFPPADPWIRIRR